MSNDYIIDQVRFATARARRETIVLMLAVQQCNNALTEAAVMRVQAALALAGWLAQALAPDHSAAERTVSAMILTARETAAPWLAQAKLLAGIYGDARDAG